MINKIRVFESSDQTSLRFLIAEYGIVVKRITNGSSDISDSVKIWRGDIEATIASWSMEEVEREVTDEENSFVMNAVQTAIDTLVQATR
jgi:hypothetical protein